MEPETWSQKPGFSKKPGFLFSYWDTEDVNFQYLQTNAPKLLNTSDRSAQKATYKGEIFPSEQPAGIYAMNSLEFFQRDREKNPKGIIAIDLLRWEA